MTERNLKNFNSTISKTINPDLHRERNRASFDINEFQIWRHSGANELRVKREIEDFLYKCVPKEEISPHHYSHEEQYSFAVKQCVEAIKGLRQLQEIRNPGGKDIWPGLFHMPITTRIQPCGNPLLLQFIMAAHAVKCQGTDEQYERFGKPIEKIEILATYAQTELGHGTYLRSLETRADYDRNTQEFVLNTPTITAYKWWPGGLGQTANHCVLVAQLYVDNQSKGIQMFFVQLRDKETHMPLPGIHIGDIGKKFGFLGTNNGFLGLRNVRIPRLNMLMRHARIHPDGTFEQISIPVLTYFTMVYTRCLITINNSDMLSIAATISTRYSAVRRQSPINSNEPEPQIIDHVSQQLKLFPQIAIAIANLLSANSLYSLYQRTSAEIERGEYAHLQEIHALSCCLKVLCSNDSVIGIECLRRACGGHGFSIATNLAPLYVECLAACTYEGENTVLMLQVGRFLINSWQLLQKGEELSNTVAYIEVAASHTKFPSWTGSWQCIIKALEYVAANKIRIAFEHMNRRLKEGQTKGEAANNTGIEYIQAAELHGRVFICSVFLNEVTGSNANQRSTSLNNVLKNLLDLYLVHTALQYMADILRFIHLTEADIAALHSRLEEALKRLRPDAVAICDGFDYHDRALNSVLGSYDGNVYERIFESAMKSPLNQKPVPQAFHQYLKPFLKSNI